MIVELLSIGLSLALVIGLMAYLNLVGQCKQVLLLTKQAGAIGQDSQLSDLAKEQQTQQVAKQLMKLFGQVLLGSMLAFGSPVLLVWGLGALQLVDTALVIEWVSSVSFVIGFSVLMIVFWLRSPNG